MSVEAEAILAKAKRIKNVAKDGELVQKAVRYATYREREARKDELARVEASLGEVLPGHALMTDEGRNNLKKYHKFLKKQIDETTPPTDLSDETKNVLLAEERRLADDIRQGMLSREVDRRNPPGAVGAHTRWEKAKKDSILYYQNLCRINHWDDESEDVGNVELLRPETAGLPGSAATFMAGAQIPGYFAMSAKAKENWPENMPEYGTVMSPLKLAEQRELEELRAYKAEVEAKKAEHARKCKEGVAKAQQRDMDKQLRAWQREQAKKSGVELPQRGRPPKAPEPLGQNAEGTPGEEPPSGLPET